MQRHTGVVGSRWTLSAVNQLASGLTHFGMREFIERRPAGLEGAPAAFESPSDTLGAAEPRTAADAAKLLVLATALLILGSGAVAWLGAVVWWLATGRGHGGSLMAAGAVTPRPYRFRYRPGTARQRA